MSKDTQRLICLAEIAAAHGVRGLVKLRFFGENSNLLTNYGALTDETGTKEYKLVLKTPYKEGGWLAEVNGISDRTEAEKLRGVKLYIPRDILPKPSESEYYHADLEGLEVRAEDGAVMGVVRAVHNFGAGDLLEIKPETGKGFYLPFTAAVVPTVNIDDGFVIVIPPEGLLD